MGTEGISETLVVSSTLKRLMAPENFITFIRRESLKSYIILPLRYVFLYMFSVVWLQSDNFQLLALENAVLASLSSETGVCHIQLYRLPLRARPVLCPWPVI
jgi:hypothetical protein